VSTSRKETPIDRPTSPDPIADPTGYQNHLLGLVGEEDPASVQASTPPLLRRLVHDAGSDLIARPEADEWSVMECIAHMVDAEVVASARYRFILAQDEPPLVGYDQDLWVERIHHDDDLDHLLELFDALRLVNVTLWARTPKDQRQRVGIHAERGPESYDLTFRMLAGHDRFHLAQAERALAAVRRV
jgi:hypothetical protein